MLTYKSLFIQVVEELKKHLSYPGINEYGKTQLSRDLVLSSVGESIKTPTDTESIVNTISDLLTEIIPPYIKSGLTVEETDPISDDVIVKAGVGIMGKVFELKKDTTIQIPFDDNTEIFFVNLYEDEIKIETEESVDSLTIAKIIVPKPGITNRVKDNRGDDYPWDAYIVNFKEIKLYGDGKGNLEEDSVDLIKDAIFPIPGDAIKGTLKLDEGMKIENTAGTLKMDSNSLKLYDSDGNMLAKFNKNGTFYYDYNGQEVAKFGRNEARVGNIKITKNSLESGNFSSGSAGFQISDSGDAEFNDVTTRGTIYATAGEIGGIQITSTYLQSSNFASGALGSGFRIESDGNAEFQNIAVRGIFRTSVFEKDTISSVGGNLLVLDSDILADNMDSIDTTLTIEGNTTFASGDVLRMKDGVDDEWMQITDASAAPTYTVTRDKASQYTTTTNYTQDADCVVALLMDADEDPLTDASGNGHTATAFGGPTFTTDADVNNCWKYDEVDDYHKILDHADLTLATSTDDWCIVILIKVDEVEGSYFQYPLSNNMWATDNSFNMWIPESTVAETGAIRCRLQDEDGTYFQKDTIQDADPDKTYVDSNWYWIFIQHDGRSAENTIKFYDCPLTETPPLSDTVTERFSVSDLNFDDTDGGDWYLATRADLNSKCFFGGYIGSFAIFSRVLSTGEMAEIGTYGLDGNLYVSGQSNPTWKKGTCVVNYGASGEGAIILSASETNSPYIDFLSHTGTPWSSTTVKTRIGRLDGLPGTSGWGIYGADGYLGALEVIDTISISSQGTIRSNLTGSYPYVEFSQSGLQLKDSSTGGTYGTAVYGTDTYGCGALAWIMNSNLKVPFAVLKEPNAGASDVADLRLFNRTDNPGGVAEIGDLAVVNGELVICTTAGTPGTWTVVGTQT